MMRGFVLTARRPVRNDDNLAFVMQNIVWPSDLANCHQFGLIGF